MAQINIRIDDALKDNMEVVCSELGINITTAFTIFAKKLTRERRIPFDVSIDPFYTESNFSHLKDSLKQLSDGKTVSKTFEDLKELADE